MLSILLLTVFFTTKTNASISEWKDASPNESAAKVRVVSSFYKDGDQKKLILGLHFNVAKDWHIYGNESGGIGMVPSVDFAGSTNYSDHKIFWPQAILKEEKIGKDSIKYSVYEGEVILPVEIILKENQKPTQLNLKLNYGLCKDVCIPVDEDFVIIPLDEEDNQSLSLIQKFLDKKITTASQPQRPQEQKISISLLSAILAAALGGLILNIMPCVLPVIGIKLMSILKCERSKAIDIRIAFLSTALGIIASFAIFSIFAIIIKFTGNIFNWGLQFQNPYFLIFLITVLLGFVANMAGFFEINFNQLILNFFNKKISEKEVAKNNIFIPNFLSGILVVLLATPCSAPFLGSAISFSITQSSSIIFLIFIVMGVGLSTPYLVLMASPKMIFLLPKPGHWMIRVKQVMIGFLIATVAWLIYILSGNISSAAGAFVALISALFFVSFRIKIKSLKIFSIVILAISLIVVPATFKSEKKTRHSTDMIWIKFDEQRLYDLVAEDNIVIIDITADWCITCKFNKLRVFHDEDVVKKLRGNKMVAMRADITKPDEDILNFIHKKGRYAIPFNAVYGPNAKEGLLTNELLSKKELLELIDKASNK